MAENTGRVFPSVLEDPKSQELDYKWCEVGVLDYDEEKKLYLVQKTDKKGLVRDEMGMPIVNGGVTPAGTSSVSSLGGPSSSLAQHMTTAQSHQLSLEFCLTGVINQGLPPHQFETEDLEMADDH